MPRKSKTHGPVTHGDHIHMIDKEITNTTIAGGDWNIAATWKDGKVPDAASCVRISANTTVTINGNVTVDCIVIEGILSFDRSLDTKLTCDTVLVEESGKLDVGSQGSPVLANAVIEFSDNGPIVDWEMVSRGLIVKGDFSSYGKETSSTVKTAALPRKGDTKLNLASAPINWQVGGEVVVPGVRPTLPIPEGAQPPTTDRDPVFRKQHEVRKITAITGTTVTIDKPLEYDLHHLTKGVPIPIGYLTRNITFQSKSIEHLRRGHIMVMPNLALAREYTVAYTAMKDMGRTSQEMHITDPQKDAAGVVIPATVVNPRGRYAIHFHKAGFVNHATVKGCAISGGLKWGFVNHASNVDFLDNISFDVRGAGFSTEIGNEVGSFQRCVSICNLGFGDLNVSLTRTGRQASKGRSDLTPEEKIIAPLGPDFGFNGAGFWLQGTRLTLVGNESYGTIGTGFEIEPLPFGGTDHAGRPLAIYVSDLTPEEKTKLVLVAAQTKITINNYPLTIKDSVAMGGACGLFDWMHPIGPQFGGSKNTNLVVRNCPRAIEIGECGYEIVDGLDAYNEPEAMNKRPPGVGLDLYNRVDLVLNNAKMFGFHIGIPTIHNGTIKVTGTNTRIDCATDVKISAPNTPEISIEVGEECLVGTRKIVWDGNTLRKVFWRRPGQPGLKIVPAGTPGGIAMPGLVNCVALPE